MYGLYGTRQQKKTWVRDEYPDLCHEDMMFEGSQPS